MLWSACQTAAPRVERPSFSAFLAEGRMFEAEAVLRQDRRDPLAYAELVLGRDDLPEAEALADAALRVDPGNRRAQLVLARARERHGDFALAVPVLEELHDTVWECRAALDANQNPAVCAALKKKTEIEAVGAYAAWLLHAGQPQAAETELRQSLAHHREAGPKIRTISRLHYELALALRDQQHPVAAEAEFWRALAIQREVLGGSLYIADTLYALGAMKLDQGWPASFEPFLKEALEIRGHLLDANDWRVVQARGAVAACLSAERRFDQAGPSLLQAYESIVRERGLKAPEAMQLRDWWEAHERRPAVSR
ncbi:MAG TPA: hypothetical protein DEQ47_09290 [Solibacterales bacterium]|nr:hypothetical protein [Bryobacterales bacterium]